MKQETNLERNNKSGKRFFEKINKIDTYWQDCSRKREKILEIKKRNTSQITQTLTKL